MELFYRSTGKPAARGFYIQKLDYHNLDVPKTGCKLSIAPFTEDLEN